MSQNSHHSVISTFYEGYLSLGGNLQYISVEGENRLNPFFLYLHGGPGIPESAFLKSLNPHLFSCYNFIFWEQRGSVKSFDSKTDRKKMTIDQFTNDTVELSEWILKKFHLSKIGLMCHSWGTIPGTLAASKKPSYFFILVNIGQVINQWEAENLSLNWIKEQASSRKKTYQMRRIKQLKIPDQFSSGKSWLLYLSKQRKYVFRYGGAIFKLKGEWPIIRIIIQSKDYSLLEKFRFYSSSNYSIETLWPEIIKFNFFERVQSIQIPCLFIQGKNDWQTPTQLVSAYYHYLIAPIKKLAVLELSAHNPHLEEADSFNNILFSFINAYSPPSN